MTALTIRADANHIGRIGCATLVATMLALLDPTALKFQAALYATFSAQIVKR
ncbi:hypothetical protein [Allomesorhizobium alhagi]|uniref:Uncharacterized protein n=1 Tax=Mesorhizobium alhagi CCNWXJ12-2 TaxID=1107882 RepID=H0HUK5_9HYPH|nr:hypothetical protein [Mesorhizobium alhagi]EHK55551.1 hypothetical protein MAXJ12_19313 [Mesorhizobium alhagi CCNWXJ12-2]